MTKLEASDFSLNHMVAPRLPVAGLLDLAKGLGASAIEVRNDLAETETMVKPPKGLSATAIGEEARKRNIRILSINGLQRFNDWNDARAKEAAAFARECRECGAEALVLVPVNDHSFRPSAADAARGLRAALKGLAPILADNSILGLIEPLGFEECSLRLKASAVEAIEDVGQAARFKLVHDTFHHYVAGETAMFPERTGLVHISGVSDASVSRGTMRDPQRVLVDGGDRIDNAGQIAALRKGGYKGHLSFEPFAAEIHKLADIKGALAASMAWLTKTVA